MITTFLDCTKCSTSICKGQVVCVHLSVSQTKMQKWILIKFTMGGGGCTNTCRASLILTRVGLMLDSSFGIATRLRPWQPRNRSSLPGRGKANGFCFLHSFQTCSWVHLPSYPLSTGGSFPGRKAAWAWSWSPVPRLKMSGVIPSHPHASLWHGC
jgi:hypothetical protein